MFDFKVQVDTAYLLVNKRLDKLVAKLPASVGVYTKDALRTELRHMKHSIRIRTTITIRAIMNKIAQIGFVRQSFPLPNKEKEKK